MPAIQAPAALTRRVQISPQLRQRSLSQGERPTLKVGLTGGVGSGKSAVGLVWAHAGVPVLESDAIGRALMQPGQAVHAAIVEAFGPGVVAADGTFDRAALARQAFAGGRLAELSALIHPAVLAAQEQELTRLAEEGKHPLAVVESALIFEASADAPSDQPEDAPRNAQGDSPSQAPRASPGEASSEPPKAAPSLPGWRQRFDKLVLVAAPEPLRIARYIARVGGPAPDPATYERLRQDALRRIAAQLPDSYKRPRCDYILENDRTLVLLRREALHLLTRLRANAQAAAQTAVPSNPKPHPRQPTGDSL